MVAQKDHSILHLHFINFAFFFLIILHFLNLYFCKPAYNIPERPKYQEGKPQISERLKVLLIFKKIFKVADFSIETYCARTTLHLHNTFLYGKIQSTCIRKYYYVLQINAPAMNHIMYKVDTCMSRK